MRWAVALLVLCATAHAESYRLVVDRAELEPASIGGYRLRVGLSAVAVGGTLLDLDDPKSLHVFAGGSEIKAPVVLGRGASDVSLVLVVETTGPYVDVLPVIADALGTDLLTGLPATTQVALIPYGEAIGSAKLGSLKSARNKVTALSSDGSSDEPALLDAVDRALILLKKVPRGRKLIVVIGDGRDRSGDRDRVTRLGKRAGDLGVRIHTLAYSPIDARRPMLALGELSKRSFGTFRWVRGGKSDSWEPALQQLHDEIAKQYVLTYFVDTPDAAGKKLKVTATGRFDATSANEIKVGQVGCAGSPCDEGYCTGTQCVMVKTETGRGILGWVAIIAAGAVGLLVVLVLIGWRLSKREAKPAPPAVAAPVKGPLLLVLSGPRANERIPLRPGFTIGKAPTCDLVLADAHTSSLHAQVSFDAGTWKVYDKNSTNGTYANGVRVTEYVLSHGVALRIGNTDLRFLVE